MKTVEERLKSYEPLWENWTYTGEFLGEGAMSSVFEIQSNAMGMKEVAALKIITVKKDSGGEVKIPENALNEIKILRTLSGSSNIVNYHDSTIRNIYDDEGNLCEIDILIKMEKLEPLTEGKSLSEEEVIKLAKDMCVALIHASDHGIIHRDIKPQNIFVDGDGNYKLGDFGIAKIVSGLSEHYTMNIGTLAYTAPEVAGAPGGKYDISSDIYSLGLVLYSFLNNGYLPFAKSLSMHDAISKRLSGAKFPSPSSGSKGLKSLVMRACSNSVVNRFKTPSEMLEALELLSSGGKKYVIDPFATLDANIDIAYEETTIYGDSSDKMSPADDFKDKVNPDISVKAETAGKRRGFINRTDSLSSINKLSTDDRETESVAVSADETKKKEIVRTETTSKRTGSLIINMGGSKSSSVKDLAPEDVEKKKETTLEKKKDSGKSFFSTPKSL